jgi:hypothetical protein
VSVPTRANFRWFQIASLSLLFGGACAQASAPGDDEVDGGRFPGQPSADARAPADAGTQPDAEPDAATSITVTHNASLDLDEGRFANCSFIDGDEQPVRNAQNNYYRVFDLSAYGVEGDFLVERVRFGASRAEGASGSQPVVVRVGHQSAPGVPDRNGFTSLFDEQIAVNDGTLEYFEVSVNETIPAGRALYVELEIPESTDQNNPDLLLVGVNDADQDEQAYYSSPGCGFESALQPFDEAGWSFNWVAAVEGRRL